MSTTVGSGVCAFCGVTAGCVGDGDGIDVAVGGVGGGRRVGVGAGVTDGGPGVSLGDS